MAVIEQCPETGLWLLPRGSEEWTRYLPSWDDFRLQAREVLLAAIATTQGSDDESWQVPVTLGLLPDPENAYNPQAVAVVLPDTDGDLDLSRQVAWVKDAHVRSLQPSITGLMAATGGHVGCHGIVEVGRYVAGEDYYDDEDDEADEVDGWRVLTGRECRGLERIYNGFRADIDTWTVVRDAVLDVISERVTDRILPLVEHRSPLTAEARAVRDDLRERGRIEVLLRAEDGHLDAWLDDLHLSRLHPDPRGFFSATRARVEALGGSANAEAQVHAGSLEVWVEDDRPPN